MQTGATSTSFGSGAYTITRTTTRAVAATIEKTIKGHKYSAQGRKACWWKTKLEKPCHGSRASRRGCSLRRRALRASNPLGKGRCLHGPACHPCIRWHDSVWRELRPSAHRPIGEPMNTARHWETRRSERSTSVGVLKRQRELQWLLRALIYHLLPELSLVADAVQLTLDMLLRYLQQAEHRMVRFLTYEVKNALKLLRGELTPCLVDTGREVLRAILPVQQLHVDIQLLLRTIVHARTGEHSQDLAEFHSTACEFRHVVLQGLEVLLVHFLVELLVNPVHILLVPLIVLRALALYFFDVVSVLANVNIV